MRLRQLKLRNRPPGSVLGDDYRTPAGDRRRRPPRPRNSAPSHPTPAPRTRSRGRPRPSHTQYDPRDVDADCRFGPGADRAVGDPHTPARPLGPHTYQGAGLAADPAGPLLRRQAHLRRARAGDPTAAGLLPRPTRPRPAVRDPRDRLTRARSRDVLP